jgi:hypothetical protein
MYLDKNGKEIRARWSSAGIKDKTVLVVECRGVPASIIKHWFGRPGEWSEGWYVWKGGEIWEDMPSVRKLAVFDSNDLLQYSIPSDSGPSEPRQGEPRLPI